MRPCLNETVQLSRPCPVATMSPSKPRGCTSLSDPGWDTDLQSIPSLLPITAPSQNHRHTCLIHCEDSPPLVSSPPSPTDSTPTFPRLTVPITYTISTASVGRHAMCIPISILHSFPPVLGPSQGQGSEETGRGD